MASITQETLYVVPGTWTKFSDILYELGSSLSEGAVYFIQNRTSTKIDILESDTHPDSTWTGFISTLDFDYKSTGKDLYIKSAILWENSQFTDKVAAKISIISNQ